MTTDYKNLSLFEAAAVVMIVAGFALISFQVFVSLPSDARSSVVSSLDILAMPDALETQLEVNEFVFGGIEQFYKEFYVASEQMVLKPLAKEARAMAATFETIADTAADYGEILASNYQANYVQPGVEASVGVKVMGAYINQLSE